MKCTLAELLMGRHHEYPPTAEMLDNANKLLIAINIVREARGIPQKTSSGYRPGRFNKNYAKRSDHTTLSAWDFEDVDGSFDAWCMANLPVLERAGLWLEHPDSTPGWTHLTIAPKKNRVFRP